MPARSHPCTLSHEASTKQQAVKMGLNVRYKAYSGRTPISLEAVGNCQKRPLASQKTDGLGSTSVSPLKVPNVFDIRLAAYREPRCLKTADAELKSIKRHDLVNLAAQVVDQSRDVENSLRNLSLEFRLATENDNRLDSAGR